MSSHLWAYRPVPLQEIRRHVSRLTHLGTPERVLAYLAYEYGPDRTMPSVAFIRSEIDRRKTFSRRAAGRAA